MKTEFEIASIISKYVAAQQAVTDFPVTLKQIGDEVDTLRMRVVEELDSQNLLNRPYFNYTQVIKFDGTKNKVKLNTTTRVRYVEVPRLFFKKDNKPAIAYIGDYNGKQNYRVVAGLQKEWHTKDQWIGRLPTALVIENPDNNGYLIEFKGASPNQLRMIAIFEDPSDLEPFGYNGSAVQDEGGTLYPMPSGEIDKIIGKTVESYLRTMYRLPIQPNQTVDAPNQPRANQPAQ